MENSKRFKDENLRLTHFCDDVLIECPSCSKQAKCVIINERKTAKLVCLYCGLTKVKTVPTRLNETFSRPAHSYFDVSVWLYASFKDSIFWAYNFEHLIYLESYIKATLREHADRTHFTLLEKLPKFYHEAKNREPLLKLIAKLKSKT